MGGTGAEKRKGGREGDGEIQRAEGRAERSWVSANACSKTLLQSLQTTAREPKPACCLFVQSTNYEGFLPI